MAATRLGMVDTKKIIGTSKTSSISFQVNKKNNLPDDLSELKDP